MDTDPVMDDAVFEALRQYHRCGSCSQVFAAEAALKYLNPDEPSPCCGEKNVRGIWPEPTIVKYVETARRLGATPDGQHVQAIMLAAGAELVLQQVVWAALEARIQDADVAIAVMDRCDGFAKLKAVYRDLVHSSVKDVLCDAGFKNFPETWEQIVRARNHVAHGQWHHPALPHADLATFADQMIPAMVALWNEAYRSGRKTPAST